MAGSNAEKLLAFSALILKDTFEDALFKVRVRVIYRDRRTACVASLLTLDLRSDFFSSLPQILLDAGFFGSSGSRVGDFQARIGL